jgi:hypothetical protein
MPNGSRVMVISIWGGVSGLEKLEPYGHLQQNSGRPLNTKILENIITFLTRGRTQNSDLKRRVYCQLSLSDSLKEGFLILI